MIITLPQVKIEATDILTVKAITGNSEASYREAEAKDLSIINANFKTIGFREVHINITVINTAPTAKLFSGKSIKSLQRMKLWPGSLAH